MLQLDQISIYPIKSCAGIDLSSSQVLDRGFPLDRRWLLVEKSGQFISQRNTHILGQIRISIENNHLSVGYFDRAPLRLDLEVQSHKLQKTTLWNDRVHGLWLSQECDDWFSDILGRKVQLIHMNADVHRPLVQKRLPEDRTFEVSFADGYPYLLTTQASLDDLNQRLEQPVPMDRFRSNLVVSGNQAFEEDNWKKIRIGNVEFLVVKPCARCKITTINQTTGVASKEPLKTLASYRQQDGNVLFGMNLVALETGTVTVNDPVTIIS